MAMRASASFGKLLGVGLILLAGCGSGAAFALPDDIALVQSQGTVADEALLIDVAKEFYRSHPDEYDMLVFWSAPEFAPGHSFYLPVKNDVPGIGYEHEGPEFFDRSAEFGSARLQGIVWMGPDWIGGDNAGSGPRSVLGILAQETGHRWAATVHFLDAALQADSAALLEDAFHWSFYFDTGASPLGGNRWESRGGPLYQAVPVDHVEYSQLDLYLMGLLAAEEVDPLRLLVPLRSTEDSAEGKFSSALRRVLEPVTVEAEVGRIAIDQIIAAEGRRDPDAGFNARRIRQAWISVSRDADPSSAPELVALEQLQSRWNTFFSQATGGRSSMSTSLH
jgi:hypothetical protein